MLMRIKSPLDHANIWVELMLEIEQWDLLDVILYVDFCNEWPFDIWAPFFAKACGNIGFFDEGSMNWMRKTVEIFKRHYPEIPVTFSCGYPLTDDAPDVSFLDFIEVHTWMATSSDYYHKLGYKYERFTDSGYIKLAFFVDKAVDHNQQPSLFAHLLCNGYDLILADHNFLVLLHSIHLF